MPIVPHTREIPQTLFFSRVSRSFLVALVCKNRVHVPTSEIRQNWGKTTGIPRKTALQNLSTIYYNLSG